MRTRHRAAITATIAMLVFSVGIAPVEAEPRRPTRTVDPAPDLGGGSELNDDYAEISREEAELLARVEAARTAQTELRAELATLEAKVTDTKEDLASAEEALASTEEALASTEEALADAEDEETAAEAAAERADERAAAAERHLRDQIVASYVRGGDADTEVLSAILHASGPDDVSNAQTYSKVVVGDSDAVVADLLEARAARRRAHDAAETARAGAERARAAAETDRVSAETERDTQADAERFLSSARDDKAVLVTDIDEQVLAESSALAAIEARKDEIEAQMAALAATSQAITDLLGEQTGGGAEAAAGVLITNPLPGRPPGSAFGPRRHPILNTTRLHAGVDMGAPSGTTIYAPADGVVVSAGARGGYGNATVINHGSSLATLYGHQSRIDVTAGQVVERGDPIGLVGTTGMSTGPHLHFETRINGVPVDPRSIVDFSLPKISYEADAEALAELLADYQATLKGN